MFCSDPIPNVADYSSFYLDTNTYPIINLSLGSGDAYENSKMTLVMILALQLLLISMLVMALKFMFAAPLLVLMMNEVLVVLI